jgi:hypothetical protein
MLIRHARINLHIDIDIRANVPIDIHHLTPFIPNSSYLSLFVAFPSFR